MRKQFRVKKYKWAHGKFIVEGRENGKRSRKFFENKTDAQTYASLKNIELKNEGRAHAEFDSRLRMMAQDCEETLSAYGKTMADATKFFVDHLKASEKSITAADLVKKLVAAKERDGASQRYLGDLRNRLTVFAEAFDGQVVATITTAQIDEWLRGLSVSPTTRNNFRRVLIVMFNHAIVGKYATSNPAAETAKAKVVGKAPGILSVSQTARLLEAASPEVLPYVAIGLFAGLRRAELERLDWSEIDFESGLIEVTAAKAKAKRRRLVKMQPNLREWLVPVRKHSGRVTSEEFRKQFDDARVAAGITDWSNNALRHSFASYHLAHFRNAAETALEMGHVNAEITFAHYRELVKPKDAERYWNLQPPANFSDKIVQMREAERQEQLRRMREGEVAEVEMIPTFKE